MRRLIAIAIILTCNAASANPIWTGFKDVGIIYTYNGKDTLYVYLDNVECPNTKKYFTINGDIQENASQMISMVLAARMAKSKIDIYYDSNESNDYCYVKGLRIEN